MREGEGRAWGVHELEVGRPWPIAQLCHHAERRGGGGRFRWDAGEKLRLEKRGVLRWEEEWEGLDGKIGEA